MSCADPVENVSQPLLRVYSVEFGGLQQGIHRGGPFATAFVEYRFTPRTSVTFDVDNLFETSGNRTRLRFFPNRAVPGLVINEVRERNRHLSFGVTLKQSLGGGSAPTTP